MEAERAPEKISEMLYVNSAYDGGSVIMEFKRFDSSVWRVLYNKNISDKLDENASRALSIRCVSDRSGSEVSEPFVRVEKGSIAERGIIDLLKDYKKSRGSQCKEMYLIDDLLEDIGDSRKREKGSSRQDKPGKGEKRSEKGAAKEY